MEKSKNVTSNESLFIAGEQIKIETTRELSIEKSIWSLVHACQCMNVTCQVARCPRMKRVIQHTKQCETRTSGGCTICKKLVALCCHHSRHCQQIKCPVPFCANVKRKLKLARPAVRATSVRRQLAATSIQKMKSVQREDRLSRLRESLRQLVRMLKSPNTLERQNQVLYMLKSNPALKSALVKLRKTLARKRSASIGQEESTDSSISAARPKKKRVQRQREWFKHQQRLSLERFRQQRDVGEIEVGESMIQRLIHAARCNEQKCRLAKCRKMKRVVRHIKVCQRRTTGGCSVCKQLVALCCNHVRHCVDDDCQVPFCFNIKLKLEARRCDTVVQVHGN